MAVLLASTAWGQEKLDLTLRASSFTGLGKAVSALSFNYYVPNDVHRQQSNSLLTMG